MKVRIEFTVEVNQQDWSKEYGIDEAEVKEDVKRYVIAAVQNAPVPMMTLKDNRRQER